MSRLDDERRWKAMGKGLKIGPGLNISIRHRAFIAEWFNTFNETAAAKSVGYSDPRRYGSKLLNGDINPDIPIAIQRIQSKNEDEAILSAKKLMAALSEFIMADATDIYKPGGWLVVDDPKDIPPIIRQFISKVDVESFEHEDDEGNVKARHKVKLDLPPKLSAFDMLFKAQGGYAAEKHDHNHDHKLSWDDLFERMENQPDDKEVIDSKFKELEDNG